MPDRLNRQEQQQRNRVALLAAAEKVFATQGIQGASLDEVAAEAGLTKGAVYSNFAGKEDLVLAVLRHRLGEEAQRQAARMTHGPAEQLVTEFGAYWAEIVGQQELYHRMMLEFLVHALREPVVRDELVSLLFQHMPVEPHPLAPVDSPLAQLSARDADTVLKALDIGLELLTMLTPERCPPTLFGTTLRLLAGMELDADPPPPKTAGLQT